MDPGSRTTVSDKRLVRPDTADMSAAKCAAVLLLAFVSFVSGGPQQKRTCSLEEACVDIRECAALLKLTWPSATTGQKSRLRSAYCGDSPKDQVQMVCCPLLPEHCGPNNSTSRIPANPYVTALEEFPWIARLGYRSKSGELTFKCGGSLISDRYVLTAAHCVQESYKPVMVRLGEYDTETDPDVESEADETRAAPAVLDLNIDKVVAHTDFGPASGSGQGEQNDIALVRLARPVAFSESVQPVCLPLASYASRRRSGIMTTVGWRMLPDKHDTPSRYLRKADMREVAPAECTRRYSDHPFLLSAERQLCADGLGHTTRYSCFAEGGSPLTTVTSGAAADDDDRTVLDGVASSGPRKCVAGGLPGVFTRVQHYVPWILTVMRDGNQSAASG